MGTIVYGRHSPQHRGCLCSCGGFKARALVPAHGERKLSCAQFIMWQALVLEVEGADTSVLLSPLCFETYVHVPTGEASCLQCLSFWDRWEVLSRWLELFPSWPRAAGLLHWISKPSPYSALIYGTGNTIASPCADVLVLVRPGKPRGGPEVGTLSLLHVLILQQKRQEKVSLYLSLINFKLNITILYNEVKFTWLIKPSVITND